VVTFTNSTDFSIITGHKETIMTTQVSGTFEVKLLPLEGYAKTEDAKLGRFSMNKQFNGELEATSQGEMLSAGTNIENSAGYVVIEQVSGTLQGRVGTFILQHSGIMNRGIPSLNITVVPDSGTGQLIGLAGKMGIRIEEGGKHFYDFEYTLAETA